MMFTTRDTKRHTQICLTFNFKVNHQGQVTDFRFSEILDLANVRIDTKIKSVACIQPEMRKVIQLICVTLSSKVNRQGHVIFFNIFDIPDLENVRIDTKIKSVACIQPEMRKVIQLICVTLSSKVNRQGHVIFFNIFDILDLENVRIDTKIKSVACIQPEMRKVIQLICVTLSSKVNRQGQVIFFNIFDIPDLENVRIDTKIKSVACIQPEMRKVIQLICVTLSSKVNRQGQPSRSRDFLQHI